MINISNKFECCGCSACINVCPKKCIKFMEDEEGFSYPLVDVENCIKCGLCEAKCPMTNKKSKINIKKAVVLRDKDSYIAKESSSGGFFTSFARYILSVGGVVYGVAYKDGIISHVRVSEYNEVGSLRGSKYVQSNIFGIFSKIADDLKNDITVGFCGTSCQLNGLINYLEYKNVKLNKLISVDLICHGVSSPLLWKKYIEYQENMYKSKVTYVNFRYKTYGYHSGSMKIGFENGQYYYGSGRVDFMLKAFFSEISSRPSCYKCRFKDKNRVSDFTVFDAWHYAQLTSKEDDDRGYTNVLINTEKGEEIFDKIKDNYYVDIISSEDAIKLDGIMYDKSAIPHTKRNEFYVNTVDDSMEIIAKKYLNISIKDLIIERMKSIYYFNKKIR